MRAVRILPIFAFATFIAGCGPANTLVGTWTCGGYVNDVTIEFKPDGTATARTPVPGRPHAFSETTMSYRLEGHKLYHSVISSRLVAETGMVDKTKLLAQADPAAVDYSNMPEGYQLINWVNHRSFMSANENGLYLTKFTRK